MSKYLISDFSYEECPTGGAEIGDKLLREKFDLKFLKSSEIYDLDSDATYVISNISQLNPLILNKLKNCKYIIHECDYKITPSRQPWRFKDCMVPANQRSNYDLYENAQAVFVKSKDHKEIYEKNGVKGNFINTSTNFWDNSDLDLLSKLNEENKEKSDQYCVYLTDNWIKNSVGAISYLLDNNETPAYIRNEGTREGFLSQMAKHKGLVFFPVARESYCRIIVEAKCMGLSVVTQGGGYGVTSEQYFHDLSGELLIEHLRQGTQDALEKFGEYL